MSNNPVSLSTSTPIDITITWNEAEALRHTGAAAAALRDPHQYGRFETHDVEGAHTGESTSLADRLIAAPVFDNGSVMWCENYLDAPILAKVHRAHGHTAHLLWDMAERNEDGEPWGWAVLTSFDIMAKHKKSSTGANDESETDD